MATVLKKYKDQRDLQEQRTSFGKTLQEIRANIKSLARDYRQQQVAHQASTFERVTKDLAAANHNLKMAIEAFPEFKTYLDENIVKFGGSFGDDLKDAFSRQKRVCIIQIYGYSSDGALALVMDGNTIKLAREEYSEELDFHYLRPYDGNSLRYADQQSLLKKLHSLSCGHWKDLMTVLVEMFELRSADHYLIN